MNNNFYDIPQDWYNSFINMPNSTNISNPLANPQVALDRGNLFNNLYMPYKNYKYRELRPSNQREELLYDILKHNFALTDISLYLDTNPNNMDMINLYNNYLTNKQQLVNLYEKKYGPLTLDTINMDNNNWQWKNSPWPWEVTK